jgi:hypothetical protein
VLIESPVQLQSEQCWKVGMILSELIMNSARHAFAERGGTIKIELSAFGSFAQCSFMDNGSSNNSSNPGQGLKIMAALARELNGEIVHRFGAKGATSILVFPINGQILQSERIRWINSGGSIGDGGSPVGVKPSAKPIAASNAEARDNQQGAAHDDFRRRRDNSLSSDWPEDRVRSVETLLRVF